MDHPVSTSTPPPSHSSSDGVYGLAEDPTPPARPAAKAPTPAPAPAPTPAPAPAANPADPLGFLATEPVDGPSAAEVRQERARAEAQAAAEAKAAAKAGAAQAKLDAKKAKAEAKATARAGGGKGSDGPPTAEGAPGGPKPRRVVRRVRRRWDAPAWVVSAGVHLSLLIILGLVTFQDDIKEMVNPPLDTTLGPPLTKGEAEPMIIAADPANTPRTETSGSTDLSPGGAVSSGVGTGPPSATPVVGGRGSGTARVGEGTSLPSVKVVAAASGLSLLPTAPGKDLGGNGGIAGDVTFDTIDVGAALDQLAREILLHLQSHKLTVVWLFDESESMKDDQKAIRDKFSRVATELRVNVDGKRKDQPLTHAVVGFGNDTHFELEKPTADIDLIGRAIEHLRVEPSGVENTLGAVRRVVEHYGGLVRKDHKLMIVLVTDESGDDGGYVEEARQAAVSKGAQIFIIGRQSLFGYRDARLLYVDPITKDQYWPTIHRGPETADVEMLQWDGLHDRWDEQPSGFAPYELARLVKETGGVYFLLPSEESMRVRQREKAYSIKDLKEYVPSYESRPLYNEKRARSDLRRTMAEAIAVTRGFPFRRHFSVIPEAMLQQANEEYPKVTERLQILFEIEARLRALKKNRDRETERRWQAHYDLMLAQILVYQIKAYEYRACLKEMGANPPQPSRMPGPDRIVEWVLDHSKEPKAPKAETEKKYDEAKKLIEGVIAAHPNTPWADLARDELNRGFSVRRNEWQHNPQYDERAKLVPKY